jgi:hypothetical protein
MRPQIDPNQLFHDDITRAIKNLLIENVNYRNGYYIGKSTFDFQRDTIERANYILEKIEKEKHLIGL